MAKTIAVITQKGGVGKTTSVQHISYELSQNGANVLLVDLDPQGNLTKTIAGDMFSQGIYNGISDCLINETPIEENVLETKYEGVYLVPNEKKSKSGKRKNPEGTLQAEGISGYTRLQKLLSTEFCQQFDFIMIDNGPSLGLLAVNSLLASDYCLIPIKTDDFSIDGLLDTYETIKQAQTTNLKLKLLGVFQSIRDGRTKKLNKVIDNNLAQISKELNINILNTRIKVKSTFGMLPSLKKTIFEVDPNSESSKDYQTLTSEIVDLIREDITNNSSRNRELEV